MDVEDIVFSLINELLRPKYSNITFYCHNLGGFDIVFILKVLCNYNDRHADKKDQYIIKCSLRDDKIIKVKITKDSKSIIILDSYAMLSQSLSTLASSFDLATIKSKFPYKFSTENNLFYIGSIPELKYYEDISKEEYEYIYVNEWSFKDETIKYLSNDLLSLHEILTKANKQVFLDYNANMSDVSTISGLAMRIFLKDLYKSNIPNINKHSIYKDISEAYYGGITEVYKPQGKDLYYYDVNSLYPFAALQDMPGLNCTSTTYYSENANIDHLFGFFYYTVESHGYK